MGDTYIHTRYTLDVSLHRSNIVNASRFMHTKWLLTPSISAMYLFLLPNANKIPFKCSAWVFVYVYVCDAMYVYIIFCDFLLLLLLQLYVAHSTVYLCVNHFVVLFHLLCQRKHVSFYFIFIFGWCFFRLLLLHSACLSHCDFSML